MLYTGIEHVISGLRIRRIASNAYRANGTGDWTRTSTSQGREILSLLRMTKFRHARTLHYYLTGGSGEIRTLEYPFEAFPTFEIGAFNLALPRFHKLVPRKGLEPSRTFVQRPLKTPWLPLHHLGKYYLNNSLNALASHHALCCTASSKVVGYAFTRTI